MKRKKTYRVLLAGMLSVGSILFPSISRMGEQRALACRGYAQILFSLDPKYRSGQEICEGQSIIPTATIIAACWTPSRTIWINTQKDVEQCMAPKPPVRHCIMSEESACVRLRGKYTQSPEMLKPYGQVLIDRNPIFEWTSVAGSSQYNVNVLGQDKHWESSTTSLKLVFSKSQSLDPGKTYQIVIQSYKGQELQGTSVSAFSILNNSDQMQLKKYITDIQKRTNGSQAKTIVALYNTYELTDEAIKYLEAQKKSNKTDPSIYRLLGDSYLDAGFPDLARTNYQIAYRIAWESASSSEAILANKGLQNIENIIGNPQ